MHPAMHVRREPETAIALVEQGQDQAVRPPLQPGYSFRSTADSDASSATWSGPCPCFTCSCYCVVCATSPLLVVLVLAVLVLVLVLLAYPVVILTTAQHHAVAHASVP